MVMSMGSKSFTVHIPRLGITSRIFLDKIPDTTAQFDTEEEVLSLKSTSARHSWTTLQLRVFSRILVRCVTAPADGPIEIQLEFIRPS